MSTEALENLDRSERIVPLYVNSRDRQKYKDDKTKSESLGIFVGYGYLRERIEASTARNICARTDCQKWKITLLELAPISDTAIDNTAALKVDTSYERWVAETDLPKTLIIDAKQKDLFLSDPTDGADDDPGASESDQHEARRQAAKKKKAAKKQSKSSVKKNTKKPTAKANEELAAKNRPKK